MAVDNNRYEAELKAAGLEFEYGEDEPGKVYTPHTHGWTKLVTWVVVFGYGHQRAGENFAKAMNAKWLAVSRMKVSLDLPVGVGWQLGSPKKPRRFRCTSNWS